MILGHYGIAFAAKRYASSASLGTMGFAAQFLDELWPILVLAGIEQVRVVPGLMAANPLDFSYYPFSHSLVFACLWAALIGGVHFMRQRNVRSASVLGALVVSHWFLDLPMHRPDLPIAPGFAVKVGLGAWHSVPLTLFLELSFFIAGLVMYMRGTRARDRIGSWGLAITTLLLLAILASGFGGTPANSTAVATGALGLWILIPLLWWVDRHRTSTTEVIVYPGPGAYGVAA